VQFLTVTPGKQGQELLEKIKSFNIGKSVIYADAAEPKSIEEIYRAGINIKPANKDVWAGILKVKSFPLYVTKRSHNAQKELQSYKWKKDKEDNVIDEPVKANDDFCDSLRYGIYNYHNSPKFVVAVA